MKRGKKALVLSLILVFLLCVAGCTTAEKPTLPNSNSGQNGAGNNMNGTGSEMSYTDKVKLAQQIENELETMDSIDDVSVLVEHREVLGDALGNGGGSGSTGGGTGGTGGSGNTGGGAGDSGNTGGGSGSDTGGSTGGGSDSGGTGSGNSVNTGNDGGITGGLDDGGTGTQSSPGTGITDTEGSGTGSGSGGNGGSGSGSGQTDSNSNNNNGSGLMGNGGSDTEELVVLVGIDPADDNGAYGSSQESEIRSKVMAMDERIVEVYVNSNEDICDRVDEVTARITGNDVDNAYDDAVQELGRLFR